MYVFNWSFKALTNFNHSLERASMPGGLIRSR